MSSNTAYAKMLEKRQKQVVPAKSMIPIESLVRGNVENANFIGNNNDGTTEVREEEEYVEDRHSDDEHLFENPQAKRVRENVQGDFIDVVGVEEPALYFAHVDDDASSAPVAMTPLSNHGVRSVVSKDGIDPLAFGYKYLYDAERNVPKETSTSKVNERLSRGIDVNLLLRRAAAAETTEARETSIIFATLASYINKIALSKQEKTKKIGSRSGPSYVFNRFRAEQVEEEFCLPDRSTYLFTTLIDEQAEDKAVGKNVHDIASALTRAVFTHILRSNQNVAVMTFRVDSESECHWVPVDNQVLMTIASIILAGLGIADCSQEKFHEECLIMKDRLRVTMYNFLDKQRTQIRKRPGGAEELQRMLDEVKKTISQQQ